MRSMIASALERKSPRMIAAGIGLLVGLSPLAVGQAVKPPKTDPRSKPPPIAPTTHPGEGPISPANPQLPDTSIPGLEDSDFHLAQAPLRGEGTFLVEQRGAMLKLPTGEWIFVFFKNAEGKREHPMVLAPCQKLQQMEQMAASQGQTATFVVSGQVLAYVNVNYFLPTMARPFSAAAPAKPAMESAQETESAPAPEPGKDPAVRDLIRELEAQREQPRDSDAISAAATKPQPAAGPNPETGGVIPEGQAIMRRRGRMIRTAAGQWAIRFDSAPGGDASLDRPLLLVPCLTLQRMEAWAAQRGDAASFEVNGRLLTYEGRNYLLPTMFQVYPTNDLEARQGP